MTLKIEQRTDGVGLTVKVVPGASRDRIVGALGDALKVAVSKPAQEGRANAAVIALLTDALGLARGSVSILRGHPSPKKHLLIRGVTAADVNRRISEAIG